MSAPSTTVRRAALASGVDRARCISGWSATWVKIEPRNMPMKTQTVGWEASRDPETISNFPAARPSAMMPPKPPSTPCAMKPSASATPPNVTETWSTSVHTTASNPPSMA